MLQEWAVRCLARLFSAMADPTRLQILNILANADEITVGEITEKVDLSISAVSHQLGLLRDRDLVTARRSGRQVYYSLADEHVGQLLEVGIAHACTDCPHRP
jgi:DNA-binding transcriptional ArsR family regulator